MRSLAKEYIFRVLLCQDLLVDRTRSPKKRKPKEHNFINKMVGHAPGAENALHIYQTWNKNATAATIREMDAQNLLSSIIGMICEHRL